MSYPWLHLNLNKLSVDIIIASENTLYTPPTLPSLFLNSEAGPGIETVSVSRVQLSAQHTALTLPNSDTITQYQETSTSDTVYLLLLKLFRFLVTN